MNIWSRVARRAWGPLERTRGGRFAEDTLFAARGVIRGFRGERVTLRAAALTYSTILSLIPLFTVALALVDLLQHDRFRDVLGRFIQEVLAPGIRAESSAYIDRYLHSRSSGTAGGIGFGVLMISAGSLLRNLDSSLNEIWNVRKKRSWPVRIGTYFLVLILGPPFAAVSLAGTSNLQELLAAAHLPFLAQIYEFAWWSASVVGFTLLYLLAPKARVRLRPALAGGLVAGVAWELARRGYSAFAASVIHDNPVYGALGALPFFLIWVYLSWVIVLFGARLAYAVQHAQFQGGIIELGAHPRARELVAARIAQLATLAAAGADQAQSPHALAERMHVPEAAVLEIVDLLSTAGLIRQDSSGGVLPAKSPEELTLADVSSAVGGLSLRLSSAAPSKTTEFREVEPFFAQGDDAILRRLSRVTWASLLPRSDSPTKPERTLRPASQS